MSFMWAIKFLSGPKAGQEILLQKGLVVLGKDKSCQVQIRSSKVSKRHAQIVIKDEGIFIEDLNSSNGTYIEGVQIQSRELKSGNQVALCDIVFEVRKKQLESLNPIYHPAYMTNPSTPSAPAQKTQFQADEQVKKVRGKILDYLHKIVLPGVYKLAEWMEFKWVVGLFVLGFICLVTVFSTVPLTQILKSSVERESLDHAESLALTLARFNQPHIKSNIHSSLNTSYAEKRPGVKEAIIVDANTGRILAPAHRAHRYAKVPFIQKTRKLNRVSVGKIDGSTVVAMAPIKFHDPVTGENRPVAFAGIIYDMKVMNKGDDGKTLSLIIQNLFISLLLGLIMFFFLINLIEFPLKSINQQLGDSLKEGRSHIQVNYESQTLSRLCENINSMLNRITLNEIQNAETKADDHVELNRTEEMSNLVELMGFPSIAVDLSVGSVSSMNSNWSDQMKNVDLSENTNVDDISSPDLKEGIKKLVEQSEAQPNEISFGELDLEGLKLQTTCQIVMGAKKPAYAIIVFMPNEREAA